MARRRQRASSSASRARSVRSERDACQPTTKRENTSMMKATYTQPLWVLTEVRSATHRRVRADEVHCFGKRGSSSRAKKAEAVFRISLARRSSRFSRSSSRSPLVLVAGQAGTLVVVHRITSQPQPQRLGVDAELAGDRGDR